MISLDDIRGLAQLARLKLTGAEEEVLQKDVSSILDYVSQISTVAVTEDAQKPLQRNVMREDVPRIVLASRESLLKAFPEREGDYNVVRKIIQKDE
jgi:aspartyl-tRNA(Asn)/glutamyl-tRNA(Gln) amidotransferase subunit C